VEDGIEILDSNIYDLTELDTSLGSGDEGGFGWDLNAMMVIGHGPERHIYYTNLAKPFRKGSALEC
jgi:hypothetical protein